MNIGKGVDFFINLGIGVVVLFVAGVYIAFRSQELPQYAIYMYIVYIIMVVVFVWIMKGYFIKPKTAPAAKPKAKAKKEVKTAEKPAVKPAAKAPAKAPAKKTA